MRFTRIPPKITEQVLKQMIQKGEIPPEILEQCIQLYRPKVTKIYLVFSTFFLASSIVGLYIGNIAMALGSLGPLLSGLYLTMISFLGGRD
jgi:hypothetical protein